MIPYLKSPPPSKILKTQFFGRKNQKRILGTKPPRSGVFNAFLGCSVCQRCLQRSSPLLLFVTSYETCTTFSLLVSHLRWSFCGVILLHMAKTWAGSFLCLYFSHSSLLEFGRGSSSARNWHHFKCLETFLSGFTVFHHGRHVKALGSMSKRCSCNENFLT